MTQELHRLSDGAMQESVLSEAIDDTTDPASSARKVPKTAGERIHNEITYRGVDWLVNTALAVGFAYWSNKTTSGEAIFSNPVRAGFRTIFRPLAHDPQQLAKMAEYGGTFASIMVGGTLIIPQMMMLERNKRDISEWLDRKIYGDERVDNDQRFAIRYDMMANQPEKSFAAGMAARLVVLTPMLYAHVKFNPTMNKIMYQPIASVSKKASEAVNLQPQSLMTRHYKGAAESDWDFIHTTLGMDLGLTFIYSFAHEWAYKGFSRLMHNQNGPLPGPANESHPPPAFPRKEIATENITLKRLMDAPQRQSSHG